jgi:hypothetical protein
MTASSPIQSKRVRVSLRHSFWMKSESAMASSPTGTLTSKIRCHEKSSTRKPPISGPNEMEAAAATAHSPRARPRSFGGNSRVTMARPSDWIIPLPTP